MPRRLRLSKAERKRARRVSLAQVYSTPRDIQKLIDERYTLELHPPPEFKPRPPHLLLAYALSTDRRQDIMLYINNQPATVTELCKALSCAQSTVSRDLAVLREAGLVRGIKRGLQVTYEVRYSRLRELVWALAGRFKCTRKDV